MSKPLTKLPQKFRRAGLEVRVVDGWKQRTAGGTVNFVGAMYHHTASNRASGNKPALGIVTNGRATPPLPGPLCNIHVARNGVMTFVAAGKANHAGEGGPHGPVPEDSGNMYFVGFEVENDGIGEPWTREQLKALTTAFAVTLRFLDAKPWMLIGHKEWTTRKIDPAGINMDRIRQRVKNKMERLDKHQGRLSP